MTFDITQPPPTPEALGAEAKASQALLGKLRLWRGLSVVGFLVGVIAVGACVWYPGVLIAVEAVFVVLPVIFALAVWYSPTMCVVLSTVAAAVGARLAGAEPVAMVATAVVAALLAVLAKVFFNLYERCDALRDALDALNELDPADCPQVLKWCQAHPELAAYQSQVANMQRLLVKGEAAAMREWLLSSDSRAEKARLDDEQQHALTALKVPLIVGSP